jgi:hypothetical protein
MVVLTITVRTMELEFHAKTDKVPAGLDFTGPMEDAPLKPDSFNWILSLSSRVVLEDTCRCNSTATGSKVDRGANDILDVEITPTGLTVVNDCAATGP